MRTIGNITPFLVLCLILTACSHRPTPPVIADGDKGAASLTIMWDQPANWDASKVTASDKEWWDAAIEQGRDNAIRRCEAWGYTGIDPYTPLQQCIAWDYIYGIRYCITYRIEQKVQCTG